jgi:hypothetical protein
MQRPASTRVQFIDVMRLIALAQMVNGHTLNALLDEHLRHGSFYAHYLWFRGLVSVAFMLVAGLAFHLTTLSRWSEHVQNPEARRHRLLRAVELIAIGFLLRFPVSGLLTLDAQAIARGLSGLSQVDVLTCIGMSLLALEGLSRICRRPRQVVFACAALCGGAALLSAWGARLPTDGKLGLLTGWLGPQGGSSFPLLPFSGYVFAGVVIGALALPEGGRTLASRTRIRLLLTAAGLCTLALAATRAPFSIVGTVPKLAHSPSFFLQKLAAVSVALWLLTLALARVTALPRALRVLTGETLGVYIFHLFVLYGFPFGLAKRFGPTLPLTAALSVSAAMLVASVLAGLAWHAIKDLPHAQRFVPRRRALLVADPDGHAARLAQ